MNKKKFDALMAEGMIREDMPGCIRRMIGYGLLTTVV